ncbi:alanine aminotransferase 1-like isoform X1 [Argiope bruennichi]|uniref:alanine transaminase n=2 Tax=Argiope bruennichi TaxID=94029 RepID=A0A8T0FNX7_ARGBR|nr:alanine aminotransferase 1-like isoform X1 [Argiope bruennichi]XP_055929838.1 alanine aminotransferase 1-like isoform X1 [Argiope bruennichi]KAF8791160.1 Alanine aminotransferase 1 like protein [Argiope bruennichi]
MDFEPILNKENINQNLRNMEFPWPSLVVSRGNEIEKDLRTGKKYPFKEVIHAHAGDPQGMGQKPITFFQQIVSLCVNPDLLQSDFFPSDVKQRAITILENCRGKSIGSYSDCCGMKIVRQQVARFIQQRDGIPASYEDIFLSSGATDALRIVLYLFCNSSEDKPPGVMVPIPQYPLFSSTVTEYGMYQISYYLNEEKQWALDVSELQRAINESKPYCDPKVLVIINPGNPGGFVMSRTDIESIIKFAYEENLFIMADEVYQYNVYDPEVKFYSFKKIMTEMGPPYNLMELSSFMSASKGYMGECGARSGYCEIVNLDDEIKDLLIRLISARMCPPLLGQIIMYCITNPPQCNEPSYEQFEKEKNSIIQSLKERAEYCYKKFNSVEGLSCNKVVGAMYVYPRIHLSQQAIQKAFEQNLRPDEFYAMEMLLDCGVCIIPGCLFGQKPQTYHFRLTFLPQMDKLKIIVEKILKFHVKFMDEYRD